MTLCTEHCRLCAPLRQKPRFSGSYFAPGGMFQLKGDPVPVSIPKPAQDVAAARQLWETAERLTGISWRTGEPARVFARG